MKKVFTEPEIEILRFLCSQGVNSNEIGGPGVEEELPQILPQ